MSNVTKEQRFVSALEIPESVRRRIPEAQRDYEIELEALRRAEERERRFWMVIYTICFIILLVGICLFIIF